MAQDRYRHQFIRLRSECHAATDGACNLIHRQWRPSDATSPRQSRVEPNGDTVTEFQPRIVRRVLSKEATQWTTQGMIMAIKREALNDGRELLYTVAGKTGTAHKFEQRCAATTRTKLFLHSQGSPRLKILVWLYMWLWMSLRLPGGHGGIVAAPIFRRSSSTAFLPRSEGNCGYECEDSAYAGEFDDDESAEGLDPQARPWWLEQAIVSGAKDYLVVPSFKGMPLDRVIDEAGGRSIKLKIKGSGVVVRQEPQAGAFVASDTTVTVAMGLPGDRKRTWKNDVHPGSRS